METDEIKEKFEEELKWGSYYFLYSFILSFVFTLFQLFFLQLPEIRFGLIPGAGGCVSIPRRIGRQRTAYLALSARRINAATALDWGLVDAIVDAAD